MVERPRTDPGRWRRWTILVDGVALGKLAAGGSLVESIDPGLHQVEVQGGWWKGCRSNAVLIDISLGGLIELRASPWGNLGGPVLMNVRPVLVAYRFGGNATAIEAPW